ncbi:MAG: hypothetical protein KAI73_08660 [Rhodospirillaceae bacterium]|nr:hypothetical protein [Rhodospirillaceae bacterium]
MATFNPNIRTREESFEFDFPITVCGEEIAEISGRCDLTICYSMEEFYVDRARNVEFWLDTDVWKHALMTDKAAWAMMLEIILWFLNGDGQKVAEDRLAHLVPEWMAEEAACYDEARADERRGK